MCDHLQAPAASRATREPLVSRVTRVPLVKRVSQVRGHFFPHMNQIPVLCLGDVIDTSDEW